MNLFEKQSRLNQFFAQNPVNAAYLAGSLTNRTTFGHLSDIDIAVLLMEQITADQFLDYQLYFLSELAKRLESDTIDVVILNQASLLLKLQVIKYGQILFSRNEKQRVTFETRAVMDYLDFKKFDEVQSQALGRRLYGHLLPIDKEIVQGTLQQLRAAVSILRELATTDHDQFVADYHIYALAERYMQVAIEAYLTTCGTLIAAFNLRHAENYHEFLSIIASQQIIPRTLAYRLEVLTTMRDGLVHGNEQVNHDALYDYMQHYLADLSEFADIIEQKLGNKN